MTPPSILRRFELVCEVEVDGEPDPDAVGEKVNNDADLDSVGEKVGDEPDPDAVGEVYCEVMVVVGIPPSGVSERHKRCEFELSQSVSHLLRFLLQ